MTKWSMDDMSLMAVLCTTGSLGYKADVSLARPILITKVHGNTSLAHIVRVHHGLCRVQIWCKIPIRIPITWQHTADISAHRCSNLIHLLHFTVILLFHFHSFIHSIVHVIHVFHLCRHIYTYVSTPLNGSCYSKNPCDKARCGNGLNVRFMG